MVIGIDAKPLSIPFPCGLKHYAVNLINALARIDEKNTYVLFSPKKIKIPSQNNFHLRVIKSYLPWQVAFPLAIGKEKIDILHLLQQHGSILHYHPRLILTVHDYAPLNSFPKWYESAKYLFFKYYVMLVRKILISKCHAVISVSDFTKRELERRFKKKLIVTIAEGVDPIFKLVADVGQKNYFLAFSDFSPRKNIERILISFSLLSEEIRKKYHLVIVVSMDYPVSLIRQRSSDLGIGSAVKIIFRPSTKMLVELYNQACCLLYPSLYEGFGLPILEAFACGCPVITSNREPMNELGSQASLLVDPTSCQEIQMAMVEIFSNKTLVKRLREKGYRRAKKYTWIKTAKETLVFYEKIYRS